MPRITGMGCIATALTAAFAAVNPSRFHAAANAMALMGIAGEMAARALRRVRPVFRSSFLDALYNIRESDIKQSAQDGSCIESKRKTHPMAQSAEVFSDSSDSGVAYWLGRRKYKGCLVGVAGRGGPGRYGSCPALLKSGAKRNDCRKFCAQLFQVLLRRGTSGNADDDDCRTIGCICDQTGGSAFVLESIRSPVSQTWQVMF